MSYAIGGFADLWLYGDPDSRTKRPRNESASIVARFSCAVCGARAGVPCQRPTATGHAVTRGVPHFGRGASGWTRYQTRQSTPLTEAS